MVLVEPLQSLLRRPALRTRQDELEGGVLRVTPGGGLPGRGRLAVHALEQARALWSIGRALRRLGWGDRGPRVVLQTLPVWEGAGPALGPDVVAYDSHDDWRLIPGNAPALIERCERLSVARAHLTFAASDALAARLRALGADPRPLPDAVEVERFAPRPGLSPAPEVLALPGPRLVFVGGLDECFDADAVAAAARALPAASFVLVGDEVTPQPALRGLRNVHRLGRRPYAQVPSLLAAADACLLPLRDLPRSRARDPLKLYEYLASGAPCAAPPHPRALALGMACGATWTAEGFAAACRRALDDGGAEARARRVARAAEHAWGPRVAALEAALEAAARSRIGGP